MSETAIRNIVIAGGGTAGWMAAAAFSALLDRNAVKITLIESDEIGTVGVGEATIPPLMAFNHMVGIDEDEFLAACQGTFKLGIEFVDWGAIGERYFHPFGPHGQDYRGVHFHQFYLREAKRRALPDIREWSMSGVAAERGRFARPGAGTPMPLAQLTYAFHFDAGLYAQFLRRRAEANGVTRIEGKIVDVTLDGSNGEVRSLTLADGRTIHGELFVDCSGFRGLLIEEKLGTGYEDWSRWLPCDRAVAIASGLAGPPEPFTRSTARAAGWQWRIPLQKRMGNGLVYSSAAMTRDDAEATLLANLESEPLAQPRHLPFTTGRRRFAWNSNVLSLGLSSGFVEPLESTSIHLIQSGIVKLLALFPDRRFNPVERDEYNRQMRDVYEDARDFIILHYKATQRHDSDFWNYCRTMSVPENLTYKIDMFRRNGRVIREHNELFTETSWLAAMVGQGIEARDYHPAADILPDAETLQRLAHIREVVASTAELMPMQRDYLQQVGANSDVRLRRTVPA